jgi:hypothetical protein
MGHCRYAEEATGQPKMISRATMDTIASEFKAKLAAWKKADLTAPSRDGDLERLELTR